MHRDNLYDTAIRIWTMLCIYYIHWHMVYQELVALLTKTITTHLVLRCPITDSGTVTLKSLLWTWMCFGVCDCEHGGKGKKNN